jgi:uncharacterized membrane protein YjdF
MDKRAFLIFRATWLLTLIISAAIGEWSWVVFHGIVFIVTLPLVWLGRRDDHHYVLDALFSAMMITALAISAFTIWPDYATNVGYDKIFHMAGGAWLAGFAAVILRKRITDQAVFYIGIVTFALAIGGAWEVFEWVLSLLPQAYATQSPGMADAMLDLVADTLGAAIVAAILKLRRYL